jgi:hypothetical protein
MEAIKPTANAMRLVFMKGRGSAPGQHPLENRFYTHTATMFVILTAGAFQAFAER